MARSKVHKGEITAELWKGGSPSRRSESRQAQVARGVGPARRKKIISGTSGVGDILFFIVCLTSVFFSFSLSSFTRNLQCNSIHGVS